MVTIRQLEDTRRAAEWAETAAEWVVKLPRCERLAVWLYNLHIDLHHRWLKGIDRMLTQAEAHANRVEQ